MTIPKGATDAGLLDVLHRDLRPRRGNESCEERRGNRLERVPWMSRAAAWRK